MAKLNVAVIGVGRMGRHHARIYSELPAANLVAVVDADEERRETVADELGCAAYESGERLLHHHRDLHAASIAVPTLHHAAAAEPLLVSRIACLIEKPLAATAAEARALTESADRHGAMIQVGHTERFNPAVQAAAAMHITPRFMQVERISPMTFRSLDVGVVMDMMIHDLDIVMMFAGSELTKVDAAGVAVLGEHEDIANARLVFENGCVANLTASRLALKTQRRLRLFSEDAYVSLDYQARTGTVIEKSDNAEALADVKRQIAAGVDLSALDYSQLLHVDELSMDGEAGESDPLTAELSSFLACVREGRPPQVDARAGWAAVEAAERVVSAVAAHRWAGLEDERI